MKMHQALRFCWCTSKNLFSVTSTFKPKLGFGFVRLASPHAGVKRRLSVCSLLHLLLCCSFMQGSDRIGKITSDENLADSVHSQHFAGKRSLPGFSQEINITHFFKGLLALRPCERSNQTGVELVWK